MVLLEVCCFPWSVLAGFQRCCSTITSHSCALWAWKPYWQLCIKLLMCLAELHYPPCQSDKGRGRALPSAVHEIFGKWVVWIWCGSAQSCLFKGFLWICRVSASLLWQLQNNEAGLAGQFHSTYIHSPSVVKLTHLAASVVIFFPFLLCNIELLSTPQHAMKYLYWKNWTLNIWNNC